MQAPSIRHLTLWLVLAPTALLACDRDEDTDEPRSGEQSAADSHHGPGQGHAFMVDKLCSAIDCSDAQRTELGTLLTPKPHTRPSDDVMDAANTALAEAWRDAEFDTGDLAGWRDAVHGGDEGPKLSAETIVAVHAMLDARQRGVLADLLETRGPAMFFGPRGKGGHHDKAGKGGKGGKRKGGKDGERPSAEDFKAHIADAVCERVSCSADQRAEIIAAIGDGPARRRDEAADRAFAEAFRNDALAKSTVDTYLTAMKAGHEADRDARDATIVTVHRVLTPEQRATLAVGIAEHGPHALMPRGGRGRHKRPA